MKRQQSKQKKATNNATDSNSPSNFDLYLQRSSHITQVLLCVFTLVGFFFVVLPIYQKDLLEESIASKEIELRKINADIQASYEKLRNYATGAYVRTVYFECVPRSYLLSDKSDYVQNLENELNSSITECMVDLASSLKDLEVLRPSDRNIFNEEVEKIAAFIDSARRVALGKFKEIKLENAHLIKIRESDLERQVRKLGESLGVRSEEFKKSDNAMAVLQAKSDLVSEYVHLCSEKTGNLKHISWDGTQL